MNLKKMAKTLKDCKENKPYNKSKQENKWK